MCRYGIRASRLEAVPGTPLRRLAWHGLAAVNVKCRTARRRGRRPKGPDRPGKIGLARSIPNLLDESAMARKTNDAPTSSISTNGPAQARRNPTEPDGAPQDARSGGTPKGPDRDRPSPSQPWNHTISALREARHRHQHGPTVNDEARRSQSKPRGSRIEIFTERRTTSP